MNERIQELAKQATTYEKGPPNWDLTANLVVEYFNKEKFAKLIVQECLKECWYDLTPKQIADRIRHQFGIEQYESTI